MSAWILNRLISCCLDHAAVLETAGAILRDGGLAARMRGLAEESAATAWDLALLLDRLDGEPEFAGTDGGARRCRRIARWAGLGHGLRARTLRICQGSVGEALALCENLAAFNLAPALSSAVELVYADFRMHRFELSRLRDGLNPWADRAQPCSEWDIDDPGSFRGSLWGGGLDPKRALRWDGKDGRLLDPWSGR